MTLEVGLVERRLWRAGRHLALCDVVLSENRCGVQSGESGFASRSTVCLETHARGNVTERLPFPLPEPKILIITK